MSGPVGAGVFNRVVLRLLNDLRLRHVEYERARRARRAEWRLLRRAWRARMLELRLSDDPYGAVYFAVQRELADAGLLPELTETAPSRGRYLTSSGS